MNLERLEDLYEAGRLKRLHAVSTIKEHTISEHVYGAQIVAMELWTCADVDIVNIGKILMALLLHDAPEVWTGDVTAHMKVRHPEIRKALDREEAGWKVSRGLNSLTPTLNSDEEKIVNAADRLDLMWCLLSERRMGNRSTHHDDVFHRLLDYLVDEAEGVAGVEEMMHYLKEAWDA